MRNQTEYSLANRPPDPEANEERAVDGFIPEPEGRAEDLWRAAAGTAATDSVLAVGGSPSAAGGGSVGVVFVPAILCPLRHVAVHLIETPGIGRERIDWY